MANAELQVQPRTVLGKKVAALRRDGKTPGNVFGHRLESRAVEADTAVLTQLLRGMTRNAIINLSVEGEATPRTVVIRGITRDPLSEKLLHIDFYQVSMTEKMRAEVPLVLVGTSDAVATLGGVLLQMLESISIDALPADIPAHFEVDVSAITQLEGSIHVKDLGIDTSRLTLHTDLDVVVARVAAPRIIVEEAAAAEAEGEAAEGAAAAPGEGAPAADAAAAAEPEKS
jgi:large subunit ribosomal protein L25